MCNPERIIIRACVTDIPGVSEVRPWTLAKLFLKHERGRYLDKQNDFIHGLPGFDVLDENRKIKRWCMVDLNMSGSPDGEASSVPHGVYLATRTDEGCTWEDKAKIFTRQYSWRGTKETSQGSVSILSKEGCET
ncbi:hypothetical protein E4T38_06871 [Aureobasidium subglaciale]|nr:hypothetical protein E4T38_06871 [Aureobasidium subglaciale]KAI5218768.1 hypothetical protein E4T40_06719 [Aureobasidium subglaciale]KAI5222382.1 hypothetical protein E4T41_06722 [Aureobasidium subglaciale]KAI5259819.1 hypothetical protein E4T46_06525 [Aureobasidium subglaciale]